MLTNKNARKQTSKKEESRQVRKLESKQANCKNVCHYQHKKASKQTAKIFATKKVRKQANKPQESLQTSKQETELQKASNINNEKLAICKRAFHICFVTFCSRYTNAHRNQIAYFLFLGFSVYMYMQPSFMIMAVGSGGIWRRLSCPTIQTMELYCGFQYYNIASHASLALYVS